MRRLDKLPFIQYQSNQVSIINSLRGSIDFTSSGLKNNNYNNNKQLITMRNDYQDQVTSNALQSHIKPSQRGLLMNSYT